jgi:ABC-2 type transport system permease protein
VSVISEAAKVPAFVRRDLRIAASYRAGLVVGLASLFGQVVAFSFIGRLVNPALLPAYGGNRVSYLEFAAIGICFNMIVVLLLHQLAGAIRTEQMIGTLESLLCTPTKLGTIQTGSALFAVLYVPLRLALFLGAIAIGFGLRLSPGGILPAAALMASFLPFVWGLGLIAGGAVLTFRRGNGVIGAGVSVLGLGSGAFFPLALLPGWLRSVAVLNPVAIVLNALRSALLGHAGWGALAPTMLELAGMSVVALAAGIAFFRLVLRRERRLGTLGLY